MLFADMTMIFATCWHNQERILVFDPLDLLLLKVILQWLCEEVNNLNEKIQVELLSKFHQWLAKIRKFPNNTEQKQHREQIHWINSFSMIFFNESAACI